MKRSRRLLLDASVILIGFSLGILWLFGIEARDRISLSYREKSLQHSGIWHYHEMRGSNLQLLISGRVGFESIGQDRLDLIGYEPGESRDLEHLKAKAEKFSRIAAYHKKIALKYANASQLWFLPVMPDPIEPDFR